MVGAIKAQGCAVISAGSRSRRPWTQYALISFHPLGQHRRSLAHLVAIQLPSGSCQAPNLLTSRLNSPSSQLSQLTFRDTCSCYPDKVLSPTNLEPTRNQVRPKGNSAQENQDISSWGCNELNK